MNTHDSTSAKRALWEAIKYDRPLSDIHAAVANGASLLEFGNDILDPRTRHLCPPICYAAEVGSIEVIDALLASGARLDQRDYMGETPLHLAAREGNIAAAIHLVELGAEVDARDHDNRSPLYWLAMMTDPEDAERPESIKPVPPLACLLLDRGADGSARFKDGCSAFDFCPSWADYERQTLDRNTGPALAPTRDPNRL